MVKRGDQDKDKEEANYPLQVLNTTTSSSTHHQSQGQPRAPSTLDSQSKNHSHEPIDSENQSKSEDLEGLTVASTAARGHTTKDSLPFKPDFSSHGITEDHPRTSSSQPNGIAQSSNSLTSSFKNQLSSKFGGGTAKGSSKLRKAVMGVRLASSPWKNQQSKLAVNDNLTFPLLSSALSIPSYYFNLEGGHHMPAIILEAFKLAITDSHSQGDELGNEHDVFRIELEYGTVRWVVYRHLYDFYKLHYHLKKSYLIGKIQSYPRFPNQLSYAFHRATSFSSGNISQLALQRRQDLERYLIQSLKMLSMQTLRELYEFFEVGGISIRGFMGWKGREGYLSLRTRKTNDVGCFPAVFGRWTTCWVMVRDSYVAICRSVLDTEPTDILLFNRNTKLDEMIHSHLNPLNNDRIGISDQIRRIDLKVESHSDVPYWLNPLKFSLKESVWTQQHRFNSFAPIRSSINAKWYVDGAGYFHDVSEAILNAKNCIYIADWWLSPEVYLRRPPSQYPEFQLKELLRAKAEQGVEIYVLIYKEVSVSLPNNSQYTKRTLKNLHRNIKVQRHPDHVQTNGTWFWAHHEKLVVVDHRIAFLGGLDLCYGRFDDNSHRLADYNPLSDGKDIVFPGQDYCNARIRDNFNVSNPDQEIIDRKSYARMPWHDIAMQISGSAARDAARHFIERWNFIKSSKAKQRPRIPFLMPQGENAADRNALDTPGSCSVQVLRSSSEWSSGVEKENSIYTAYIESILASQHFIYIENQFFVSAAKGDANYTVKNKIGKALVDRIKRAVKEETPFRVIVVMPLMPAFPNELHESGANTIRLVMQWQYQSICRGKESVMEQLREADINPDDYIHFHGLRNYDLIPQSHLHHPETEVVEASLAGDSPPQSEPEEDTHEEEGLATTNTELVSSPPPKKIHTPFKKAIRSSRHNVKGMFDSLRSKPHDDSDDDVSSDEEIPAPAPQSAPNASPKRREDSFRRETLKQDPAQLKLASTPGEADHATIPQPNQPNQPSHSPSNQPLSAENSEVASQYVTEQVYIHSKLMIVDDRIVICGSANINDRSMVGYRDSEIAVIIEDQDLFTSTMAGQEVQVSRFAHTLRCTIFKEHLGLLSGTEMVNLINWEAGELANDSPSSPSSPILKQPAALSMDYHPDELMRDPLGPAFQQYWENVSSLNTRAFREVFRVVPDDTVPTWEAYRSFLPNPDRVLTGHPDFRTLLPSHVKPILGKIRGHLVDFPAKFLQDETFSLPALSAESMIPVDVFI